MKQFKKLDKEYEDYDFKEVDITGYEDNKITADRLIKHECIIGESIHDDFEGILSVFWETLFVGHLMTKREDLALDILEIVNRGRRVKYIALSELQDLFNNGDTQYPCREFYTHYARFANITVQTRRRFNKHMICISVGYGEEPNI